MSKKYRLILMILSSTALVAIGWFINRNFLFLVNDFWFTAGLLLLVLLSLIDQPHFSKDSNILINSITAALSLLLIPKEEHDFLYWGFFAIVTYLMVSSYVLLWLRKDILSHENGVIQFLTRINREIGKPEVIFSSFFLWGGVRQYTLNSSQFNALLWFWIVFMLLNIPALSRAIEKLLDKGSYIAGESIVGKIFGVQSKNTFLVKLVENIKVPLQPFDFVEFLYSIDKKNRKGFVLETYYLNLEQWCKVLCSPEIDHLYSDEHGKCEPDVVYKIAAPSNNRFMENFIGIVAENSVIEKIKFNYNSSVEIYEGQLVELCVGAHKILYQIVQGVTRIEHLEDKNESSYITGEAIQLGEWNEARGRFELYGWVPSINTPIFLASSIKEPTVIEREYIIGRIPGTNYPVIIDKELAVTHHTAVLGITGAGKSVFTRDLINKIANETTKVIIVDLTGEYRSRFENISTIISELDAITAFSAIETLATEKAKFANQQCAETIRKANQDIELSFTKSINGFVLGTDNKSIFELPDISNSSSILEYTKWFFYVLFKIAKNTKMQGKRLCVVLEEAHTIVPENHANGAEKSSQATVNSIAQIALQGRKYNIGFIVVAQRTANVSKTVLTQCNSIISFQELDNTSNGFLANYLGDEYIKVLPKLRFKTAIAVGKAFRSTVPMIFEVPIIHEEIYQLSDDDNHEQKSKVNADQYDF